MANPTRPADNPVPVETEIMEKPAAARMISEPMNSSRTPSHRIAILDGKYARKLASTRRSFSSVNRFCCRYPRMVVMPPSDSWKCA